MKIIQSYLTNNACFRSGRFIDVRGLMLHSVGCPQPSAQVFVDNWNVDGFADACVHAFIDANTGEIYQTMPWNRRAWHCGDQANNTHIGVEMCEPAEISYRYGSTFDVRDLDKAREAASRTYNSAVELFAYLCEKYNLNPLENGVIISHAEGAAIGIASDHDDPEHLWNGLGMNLNMNKFRIAVAGKMGISARQPKETFLVEITVPVLNIRSGAGTTHSIMGTVHKGDVFTIVETFNGWGKLKSGAGWIYLPGYTERI